jgi:conjugative relaxase-like TrwC/TraI family protein
VLSIGKLGQGQESYYLEAVAQGVEDYYTGAGEAPGQWVGSASAELQMDGEVEADGLHTALGGSNPRTGDPLTATRAGTRVPGFDLTFSAPKSVSLLYGLGDEHVSGQVRDAHDRATLAAFDYLERHAAVARRGRGGVEMVPGNGFVGAAFRHRTSRAGDPQLHTHVLVANMTRGPDGRWTALDGRRLYAHAKTAGYLYQAQLRHELARSLGVEWTAVRNGAAEVAGVPAPVMRAFSRRRAEIEQVMADRGEQSARAAQIATLDSRQSKDYEVTAESLRERWSEKARLLGFERDDVARVIGHAGPQPATERELAAAIADLGSSRGLTSDRASFTRRDVIQGWCERLPSGADAADAEVLADRFLASEHAVPLATDVRGLTHSDVIRRADGCVIPATADERPHSTPELLAVERRLIDGAVDRRDARVGIASRPAVTAAIERRPTLSAEQATMVRRLTGEGDGVQVVTGKAGTGKTFALDAAREAWQAEGHTVLGAAVARRAARELEDGAGIESTSLAALLQDLRAGGRHGLPPRAVVVIDEASMAGTRQLAELLDHAAEANAKVVLVGDPHQLPEIDAGGTFRALTTRTDPIMLIENRRQQEVWEREALDHLREGRAEAAVERYERHGRVVLGERAEDVRVQLVADWWKAAGEGEAAMIAARRDDVADLNGRARALMRASGHLGPDALSVSGREFAVGDHVVALKNARHLGIVNGSRGVVSAIDAEAGELVVRQSDGSDLRLPRTYLESTTQHGRPTLDYGYAITGHKAQGMTTGKAFVLGTDDLYREWGYVTMSRGRVENHLYVVAPRAHDRDEYAPAEPERDPLEALTSSLEYSQAQTAAVDVIVRDGIARMTTSDLVAERTELAGRLRTDAEPPREDVERITRQRFEAEQAADDARRRIEGGQGGEKRRARETSAADRAIEAQARERARQLAAREREMNRTTPRTTRSLTDRVQDATRYRAISDELDRRRAAAARLAVIRRPEYLVRELGPYPERRSERRVWQRAAMRIEAYRHDFGISDPRTALGDEPGALSQPFAEREVRREIERVRRHLGREHRRRLARGRALR